jgi:hypothetical protein
MHFRVLNLQNDNFTIDLREINGIKIWEIEDIPHPNVVTSDIAQYRGQRYVEQLMKVVNQKIYKENEDQYLDSLFQIFEKSLEQGVIDQSKIHSDNGKFYTKISWTGYSWKLSRDLLKRQVKIEFIDIMDDEPIGEMTLIFKKIAEDGGCIFLSPRLFSKMNLKPGNDVKIHMRFV